MLISRIDVSVLKVIAPTPPARKTGAQAAIMRQFGDLMPTLLAAADIFTPLRIAHFLAQVAHESDGFCTLEEYASGTAYESRTDLGNIKAGDGVRFKGRGPIQLTGRTNYRAFTSWMRKHQPGCPDFEGKPELVATWPWAGWATVFFWSTKKLNAYADADDLIGGTKVINGGRNGLADRAAYLAKAKPVIARLAGDQLSASQQYAVLVRGMSGEAVERLQRALRKGGYYRLAIDGVFGSGTAQAVKAFQYARGLTVDGIVGRKTAAELKAFGFQA